MSEASTQYDVAVVGAGPGGYVAAIRAAQLGARVCLVERDTVGGTCLNRGCIPTKALVASVEAYEIACRGRDYGVKIETAEPDFPAMMNRSAETVARLVKGVEYLLGKNKVTLIQGRASFSNPTTLVVETGEQTQTIEASRIIIATGSKPAVFPSFGYDGIRVITSDEVVHLQSQPSRVVIIGGGVIGCEFASIFHGLGTQVTVVEALPTILPMIEKDVARQLGSYFKRKKITVLTGVKVESISKTNEILVQLAGGDSLACDLVLVAVGRRPNTVGLAPQNAGLQLNGRGEIEVDERMRTNVPHIYAIGDVTSCPWKLAHVASRQGIVAAHQCMDQDDVMDYTAVPAAVFTNPEVASVGLTSEEAARIGLDVTVAKFPFMAIGKAVADGRTDGFVKILAEKATDRVVGVHIIGAQAATLIAEATLAVQNRISATELARTIHAHPTLPEAIAEAAEGIQGLSIHA